MQIKYTLLCAITALACTAKASQNINFDDLNNEAAILLCLENDIPATQLSQFEARMNTHTHYLNAGNKPSLPANLSENIYKLILLAFGKSNSFGASAQQFIFALPPVNPQQPKQPQRVAWNPAYQQQPQRQPQWYQPVAAQQHPAPAAQQANLEIIKFSSALCQPCKEMEPIFDAVAPEFNGRVQFRKMNVDRAIAAQYNIAEVPTIVFRRNGQEVYRFTGVHQANVLRQEVRQHFGL